MHQSSSLSLPLVDETDLALVHALQIAPRASWTAVGQALGIDPMTAARRWARLIESGCAWVTCYPADADLHEMSSAHIQVDCAAGAASRVGRTLASSVHAVTVQHTTGGSGLLLTVLMPKLSDLSRYLLEYLGEVPGVRATRTYVSTRLFAEASHWELRTLDAEQQAVLAPHRPARTPLASASRPMTDLDRALGTVLSEDGRMTATDLARCLSVSESTVTRRLRRLLSDGQLVLRAEVAQPWSGVPVTLNLWALVRPDRLEQAGTALRNLPGLRLCAGLTGGPANLRIEVWLHSVAEASRLEAEIMRREPSLQIVDRSLALRFIKRMGRLLSPDGRGVGTVPLHLWSDPVPPTDLDPEPATSLDD
ncbi:Lrp/AsnC family transcriptional regulator [Streptomyces sp. NPDC051453]|uniref:Lrp/AsnC family transcriptional regulator n=1 Tax=Streptomyces sp. NPDC051453 TaxID=3154941 RepID=UPI0034191E88